MSDILGTNVRLSLFGESHGKMIGASLDGLRAGIKVDYDFINQMMERRKSVDDLSTARHEKDEYEFISGIYQGYTTGNMITVLIENQDVDDSQYRKRTIRPGHADYTAMLKYDGYDDYRGGGHFSGRMTAPIVALGGLVISYLKEKKIFIASRIKSIHGIEDDPLSDCENSMKRFRSSSFPTMSEEKAEKMKEEIRKAKENKDSVGGVIETYIYGDIKGIGNPFFDSLESKISHALFSCPAVKGVEFGDGFDIADLLGSEANDLYEYDENHDVRILSNHNGGILGGISNGNPIVIKTAIKPTPSIAREQKSIDMENKENISLEIKGRHDPCIVKRAIPVIESLCMISILDAMEE